MAAHGRPTSDPQAVDFASDLEANRANAFSESVFIERTRSVDVTFA